VTGPRRWWACCAVAVAFAAGGCDPTAPEPEPVPSADVACESPRIVVGEPVLGADTLTGVHRRIIAAGGAGGAESVADLLDAPVVPELVWTTYPPAIDDAAVWTVVAQRARRDASPAGARADEWMAAVERVAGTFITYVAVTRQTVPVTVTCAGRPSVAGEILTWDGEETGTLDCAVAVDQATAPLAYRAHADYC